jgi:ABC-type antimicrobial peptide transport system permease subunit
MTRFTLILRNLRYFKGVNLALIVGMAVATAVLAGALMVGNSVQASLADLARQRLGKIDDALIARQRFFEQSLARRLQADPQLSKRYDIAPAVLLSGGASNADESVRAGDVQVNAAGGDLAPVAEGETILNGPTAAAIGAGKPGQTVLISVPDKPDEVREAALARRSREDTLATLRATVSRVDSGSDMLALFDPNGGQRVPQNAWVNLADLQNQIDLKGRINAMLVHDRTNGGARESADAVNERLRAIVRLEDYGLKIAPAQAEGQSTLTSSLTYLDPPVVTAAEQVGRLANIPVQKVTVNLLNSVTAKPSGKQIHYAVAAGIMPLMGKDLADDEIAINRWTADQLRAKIGDRLHLTFYQRLSTGNLTDASSDAAGFKDGFRIASILPMSGIGADRSLTPNYKGLTDKDTVADWNPPEGIEIDKKLVTKADEDYWRQYRAAPKVFLSFRTAERLWGGPMGDVTSIRVPTRSAKQFGRKLRDQIDPASMGLTFQPIKFQQLAAASGSSDFGQYFLYFSFFIIVAAVLLVAMLFRLSVEQRARQLGVLSAVGFAPWTLRRISLAEGMVLAFIGGLLGIPAAIGYTAFIMYGLRTWWNGAVGTTALYLHVAPMTLVYGYVGSLAVAFFAIWWAVWRVGRTRTATLLAGGWGARHSGRRGGVVARVTGILFILVAIAIFVWARRAQGDVTETFLSGGTLLLIGCLFWLGGTLRPGLRRSAGAVGVATIRRLGVRNAARHTARSVLAVGLIAFAAFTLITVAAFRQGTPSDTGDPTSGAGGYRLIATAGIPLLGDLNTPQGRRVLGMTDASDPLWADVHFVSMRRWAGQDISCLNLTQPTTPTILSVPPELMQGPDKEHKHRFTFAQAKGENPWLLLDAPQSDGTIPVIADANTAEYILKKEIGQTIDDVKDAAGAPQHLKLVATLSNSIFQSELLMSEGNFRRLYPGQGGFGVVLIDTPPAKQTAVQQALNTQLGEYAINTEPTAYRLARYFQIQNTYLSTFQALGALGLMLGTIGLAVVLVRTVIERKAELALLASLGFRRADRIVLVLSENVFLLVVGLVVGTVSAVVGILPAIRQSAGGINFGALGATLLIVLLIGVAASTIAVLLSGAHVSPADLRHE